MRAVRGPLRPGLHLLPPTTQGPRGDQHTHKETKRFYKTFFPRIFVIFNTFLYYNNPDESKTAVRKSTLGQIKGELKLTIEYRR